MPYPGITAAVLLGVTLMTFLYYMYKGNPQQHEFYQYSPRQIEPGNSWRDDGTGYSNNRRRRISDQCAICLNTSASTVRYELPCGHYFHIECITQWQSGGSEGSQRCPNCRHGFSRIS